MFYFYVKMVFEEATCEKQELENRKEVKKRKIDFTETKVQRERKIKRRIVILECIPVKNIFEKIHQETFSKSGCRCIIPGQYLLI